MQADTASVNTNHKGHNWGDGVNRHGTHTMLLSHKAEAAACCRRLDLLLCQETECPITLARPGRSPCPATPAQPASKGTNVTNSTKAQYRGRRTDLHLGVRHRARSS